MRHWAILIVALLVLALPYGSSLASAALVNVGMQTLCNALIEAEKEPRHRTYSLYEDLDGSPAADRAMKVLRHAVDVDVNNPSARWALGRAALAVGDAAAAADVLEPLALVAGSKPLLCDDVLFSLSQDLRHEGVIALYESERPLQCYRPTSDIVALAYLGRSQRVEAEESIEALERASTLRPGDLYVNYHLWKHAKRSGHVGATTAYSKTLTYFTQEAVDPIDDRLLDYAAEVIPALLENGLWDQEKTLNVVSYLVWKHHRTMAVEQLLVVLSKRFPGEPDWFFYLGELYQRRGDWTRAEVAYQRTIEADPTFAKAYSRMGMLAEARCKRQEEDCRLSRAVEWYEQYNEMAPDDLLGLKKLVEIYEALGRSSASALREDLEAKTNDERIVAELLGVSMENMELGPNLMQNGGFEEWVDGRPDWWRWVRWIHWSGGDYNYAEFLGGRDEMEGYEQHAVRISGLWVQTHSELKPARIGLQQSDTEGAMPREIPLEPGGVYLLSFYYRTERPQPQDRLASLWVSDNADALFAGKRFLPATNGQWRKFVVVGRNAANKQLLARPLFVSWGTGEVWFDSVELRSVHLPQTKVIADNLPVANVR